MTTDEIEFILIQAYPKVQSLILKSELTNKPPTQPIPKIELHRDIYARLSGDPEMRGEESETSEAQYDEETNKIYIYYPNMKDEEHVLRSLIHEYTHYLQNLTPLKKAIDIRDNTYDESPYEQESHRNEDKYIDKLLDNENP
jgi:hypothetical protein